MTDLNQIIADMVSANNIIINGLACPNEQACMPEFSELVGKTIKKITIQFSNVAADDTEIHFANTGGAGKFSIYEYREVAYTSNHDFVMIHTECGQQYIICPPEDYNFVDLEAIVGDLAPMIGSPIKITTLSKKQEWDGRDEQLWTDFNLKAENGAELTLKWFGVSPINEVSFLNLTPNQKYIDLRNSNHPMVRLAIQELKQDSMRLPGTTPKFLQLLNDTHKIYAEIKKGEKNAH